jgi:hypothetical protein
MKLKWYAHADSSSVVGFSTEENLRRRCLWKMAQSLRNLNRFVRCLQTCELLLGIDDGKQVEDEITKAMKVIMETNIVSPTQLIPTHTCIIWLKPVHHTETSSTLHVHNHMTLIVLCAYIQITHIHRAGGRHMYMAHMQAHTVHPQAWQYHAHAQPSSLR